MSLSDAQRIFGQILQMNLNGPLTPISPGIGAGRALPKGVSAKKIKRQIIRSTPLPPQLDRSEHDAASYILQHATYGKNTLKPLNEGQTLASIQEDEEPGVVTKIMDTLQIPINLGISLATNIAEVATGQQDWWDAQKEHLEQIASGGARLVDNAFYKPNIPFTDLDENFYQGADRLADKSDRSLRLLKDLGVPAGKDISLKELGVFGGIGGFLGSRLIPDKVKLPAREIGDLGISLAFDPLNFVGAGSLGAAGKAVQASKRLELAAAQRSQTAKSFGSFAKPIGNPIKLPPVAEDVTGGPGAFFGGIPGSKQGTQAFRQQLEQFGMPKIKLPEIDRYVIPSSGAHMNRRIDQGIDFDAPGGSHATVTPEVAAAQRSEAARHASLTRHYGKDYENFLTAREQTLKDRLDAGDFLRDRVLAKGSKVADKRGFVSMTAVQKSIDDIRSGIVSKDAPEIIPLKEPAAVAAVKSLADDFAGKAMTPARQIQMYYKIKESISTAKLPVDKQQSVLISAIKTAEDHLANLGRVPEYSNRMGVRLSDVISESVATGAVPIDNILADFAKPYNKIQSPVVKQAIDRSIARRSILTGTALSQLSKLIKMNRDEIVNAYYHHPRQKIETDRLVAEVQRAVEKSKLTDAEREGLMDHIRVAVDVDKLPADVTMEQVGKQLSEAVASGRVNAKVVMRIQKDIQKTVGKPSIFDDITGNKVIDRFMLTMTTWWGKKDIIRSAQDVFTHGEQNAVANAKLMRQTQSQYTPDERKLAWAFAAGRKSEAETPRVAALGMMYLRQFEHMFGSSGLKDELFNGTVAIRSQLSMDDINKQLKRLDEDFRFKAHKETTVDGRRVDYSGVNENGVPNWLRSWESYTPPDPSSFLYNVNLAMERVTKEYAWLDNLAHDFGSLTKGGANRFGQTATFNLPTPRLKDFYFPDEIGKQILRVLKDFEDPRWLGSKAVRQYARGLRIWKLGVTIYNPNHHIRNGIGDSFLMWMAGINDPRVFTKAQRVIYPNRARYGKAIKSVDANSSNPVEQFEAAQAELMTLLGPKGHNLDDVVEWSRTSPTDVISSVKGTRVSANTYYVAAHRHGLLPDANQAEDVFGETAFGKVAEWRPIGVTHKTVTQLSEYREHYFRIAHYIGATEKNLRKGMKLPDALETAAHEVRKWHPDGRDLTNFEQKIRLLVPFYSWLRKSTPLIIQGLAQRPAKILAYPKIHQSLQQMLGIEGSIEDPFPDDALFPDWMRGYGMGPLGEVGGEGLAGAIGEAGRKGSNPVTGEASGYTLLNPGNPFQDFVHQFLGTGRPTDVGHGVLESITPFARVPFEVATGREISGQPIETDPSGYVGENIPFVAPASRIFNIGPFGATRQAEQDNTNFDTEAFINWLSALGLRGAGPYSKSAEFDARERAERFANRRTYSRGN